MKVVLVYLIRGKAGKYQQSLVKRLSEISGERYMIENPLPAHVTLKYFSREVRSLKKLESTVSSFVKTQRKAPVIIEGFDKFKQKVVFLKTKFSKAGKEIQKELVKCIKNKHGIKPHKFDLGWKPHATVAYGNSKDTFNIIWNYIRKSKPHYKLDFDNVAILTKPKNRWQIHKVYNIK